MDSIEHIQQAMKHLMMAMAKDEDEERGVGITRGWARSRASSAASRRRTRQLSARWLS